MSLVALITWRDLLLCAKHLFVAAIGGGSTRHWEADSRPRGSEHFQSRRSSLEPRTGPLPLLMAGAARLGQLRAQGPGAAVSGRLRVFDPAFAPIRPSKTAVLC